MLSHIDHSLEHYKISLHQISGANIIFFLAVIFEVKNAGVFKEKANNGGNPDGFGKAFDYGPQTAGITDNKIDGDAGLRCPVEGGNDVASSRALVSLDMTGMFDAVLGDFPFNTVKQALLEKCTILGEFYSIYQSQPLSLNNR